MPLPNQIIYINLRFDGMFKLLIFDEERGLNRHPPIFICENNRKSIKIMHCIDFFEW